MKSYELPNNVLMSVPEPLVSVRTSTYNHGKYIRQCIEGVLMQKTDFPFEYIIGEDCSTDDTMDIVKEYAEKYPDVIRVVTADRNVGMKGNGVRCIERCRGKYIAICEGDDYWTDPFKLQRQVDFLESHPQMGVCATECNWYIQKTGQLEPVPSTRKYLYGVEDFMENNQVYTLTTLVRADWVREYQFDVAPLLPFFRMGDYSMWLYLLSKSPIVKLNEYTCVYRVLENSASHFKSAFQQMKFAMASFDIRCYFNELMGYHVPRMKYRKWRDTYRICRNMKSKKIHVLYLFFRCAVWMMLHPVPRPSRAIRKHLVALQSAGIC